MEYRGDAMIETEYPLTDIDIAYYSAVVENAVRKVIKDGITYDVGYSHSFGGGIGITLRKGRGGIIRHFSFSQIDRLPERALMADIRYTALSLLEDVYLFDFD
jgi:hypothetical protein